MNQATDNIDAKLMAAQILSVSAQRASHAVDSFVSWLLAGFGAAISLFIANFNYRNGVALPPDVLRGTALLFATALCFGVTQKLIAVLIGAAVSAADEGRKIGLQAAREGREINLSILFNEVERGLVQPGRWFARRSINKAMRGDFAAGSRTMMRFAQLQSVIALISVALVIRGVYVLAASLWV